MIKRIFLLSILTLLFTGCEGSGRFGLDSSLMGRLAKTTVTTHEKNGQYSITVHVASRGLYNLIRGKRIEEYRSEGLVKNGQYFSRHFAIEKWANGKHTLAEYTFDYAARTIVRRFRAWTDGGSLIESATDKMPYFGHNDFLTVMRNAVYGKPRTSGRRERVVVAGADNSGGWVPVYVSNDPRRLRQWDADPRGTLIQIGVSKAIFDGGKGSLTVLLDNQNRPDKIIIKEVKIVGTVTGKPIQ